MGEGEKGKGGRSVGWAEEEPPMSGSDANLGERGPEILNRDGERSIRPSKPDLRAPPTIMSPAPIASTSALTPTTVSKPSQTFHTLTREARFRFPPQEGSDVPALDELVKPHIDSFNALLEDSDADASGGGGLLGLAVRDIGDKVVFDSTTKAQGNRLTSESFLRPFFGRFPPSLRATSGVVWLASRKGWWCCMSTPAGSLEEVERTLADQHPTPLSSLCSSDRRCISVPAARAGQGQARKGATGVPCRGEGAHVDLQVQDDGQDHLERQRRRRARGDSRIGTPAHHGQGATRF